MSSGIVHRKRHNNTEDTDNSNESLEETKDEFYGLTLMEEIILLGIKDSEGLLSFWNDNISYVFAFNLGFKGCHYS
jgi:Golgi phosphoprotein 3